MKNDMVGVVVSRGILSIMKGIGKKMYLSDLGDWLKIMGRSMRVNFLMEKPME